jgi:Phage protein Gp138 N-terminal domain
VSNTNGFFGQLTVPATADNFNARRFQIQQLLAETRTGIPVKVTAVHGGGVGAPPTVDVQPLINQLDSQGNMTPHGPIFGLPVCRVQGGNVAVIIDPVVGDVGWAVAADRDISALKNNAGVQSNPASFRRHNLSDLVYQAAFLNPAIPSQYIEATPGGGWKFLDSLGNSIVTSAAGITFTDVSGNSITLSSSGISFTSGSATMTMTASGLNFAGGGQTMSLGSAGLTVPEGTITNQGIDVGSTHSHSGVTTGASDTGPPI